MAENLYLRLSYPDLGEESLEWMLLDETSGISRFKGEGSLDEFRELRPDLVFNGRTFVMVAGEDVLLTHAQVPSKQVRQILQAVPYVVEEQIASDVDTCHFAIGGRDEAGFVSVAIVDDQRMKRWVELLDELKLTPTIITSDLLVVPTSGDCHVFVEGERALIKIGLREGLCVTTDMLANTLSLLPPEARQTVVLTVPAGQAAELQLTIDQINAEAETPLEVAEMEYAPFESLARSFKPDVINLLQGNYKVEDKQRTERNHWRSVAIAAGCAVLLHLVVVLGQAIYLDVQARQIDAEARALYASIYPGDRNVRDMRRRWQNHLRGSGSGVTGEFMRLFVETTKHIPGANLNLNNVNYSDSRGDLVLQLEAGRSEQLIGFAETLNKMGLEAEIGTINQSDDTVRGSVKVKMLGGS